MSKELKKTKAGTKGTKVKKVENRGGSRPGAGRPAPKGATFTTSVRLTKEDKKELIKKYGSVTNAIRSLLVIHAP